MAAQTNLILVKQLSLQLLIRVLLRSTTLLINSTPLLYVRQRYRQQPQLRWNHPSPTKVCVSSSPLFSPSNYKGIRRKPKPTRRNRTKSDENSTKLDQTHKMEDFSSFPVKKVVLSSGTKADRGRQTTSDLLKVGFVGRYYYIRPLKC